MDLAAADEARLIGVHPADALADGAGIKVLHLVAHIVVGKAVLAEVLVPVRRQTAAVGRGDTVGVLAERLEALIQQPAACTLHLGQVVLAVVNSVGRDCPLSGGLPREQRESSKQPRAAASAAAGQGPVHPAPVQPQKISSSAALSSAQRAARDERFWATRLWEGTGRVARLLAVFLG
eukprot:3907812-Prymnesium_polylepis.1